jgi:hypothetical protein
MPILARMKKAGPLPGKVFVVNKSPDFGHTTRQLLGFAHRQLLIFGGILPILQISFEMKGCFAKQT